MKAVKWQWGDKEQAASDRLRQKLCSTTVLTCFKPGRPLLVEMDSSNYVCSGILSQHDQDGKSRLISYRLETMTPAECTYDVHDKKLLPIVPALKQWRRYLRGSGQYSKVLTHHKNLIRFTTTKGRHASRRRPKAHTERKDSLAKRKILSDRYSNNGNNRV